MSTDDYQTDKWLKNIFAGWLDPCPYKELDSIGFQDGLLIDWNINTFVNPPYSNVKPWVRKAINDNREFGSTIVLLLKMDTSTMWFAELKQAGAKFLWINRRLRYGTGRQAPFPSMIAVLEGKEEETNIPSY